LKIKKIIILSIVFTFIFSIISMASTTTQNIAVEFNSVNITVNGNPVYAGNILYNGTTYVPIRATANMLDCKVDWDAKTNTAIITQTKSDKEDYFEIYDYLEILESFYFNANFIAFCALKTDDGIYDRDFLDSIYYGDRTILEFIKDIAVESEKLYEYILKNKSLINLKFSTIVDFEILCDLFNGIDIAYNHMQLIAQSVKTYDEENVKLMSDNEILESADQISGNVLLSSASKIVIYTELKKLI